RLRPDPEFLFAAGEFQQAMQQLGALVAGGHGVLTLTGDPGSGKSTVLRTLAAEPDERRVIVRLPQPDIAAPRLLERLHQQLDLPSRHGIAADSIEQLARWIAEQHAQGRQLVIIVDDAHQMPQGTLRQLLRLAVLQPAPLLLLAGEPELLALLHSCAADTPLPTVGSVSLPAFGAAETVAYVPHRLRLAGAQPGGQDIFDSEALLEVYRYSGGVPALINVLADAAMSQARTRLSHAVNVQDVRSAARALHWSEYAVSEIAEPPPVAPPPAAGAVLRVMHKGQPLRRLALAPGTLVIGRTDDCDLKLDGSFVSRRHCQIVTDGERSVIEDLGSTNGIAVNGSRHQRDLRHELRPGDEVRIGDYTLSYLDADVAGG
ncbi:MAG: FHA domain-containing protein, partial [Gammaproteobacteria bacterium]|nr:FHA domain-containing protein [Gammaproteobacteria bacterium]